MLSTKSCVGPLRDRIFLIKPDQIRGFGRKIKSQIFRRRRGASWSDLIKNILISQGGLSVAPAWSLKIFSKLAISCLTETPTKIAEIYPKKIGVAQHSCLELSTRVYGPHVITAMASAGCQPLHLNITLTQQLVSLKMLAEIAKNAYEDRACIYYNTKSVYILPDKAG